MQLRYQSEAGNVDIYGRWAACRNRPKSDDRSIIQSDESSLISWRRDVYWVASGNQPLKHGFGCGLSSRKRANAVSGAAKTYANWLPARGKNVDELLAAGGWGWYAIGHRPA